METLVLDAGYQPVARVPWETAIVMVLKRVVDVIDEYPDKDINTVNWSVKMPSVIKFVRPVHKKKAIKFSRHNVYARDKGRCQYCGVRCSRNRNASNAFTYEHVVPRKQGGTTCWENIVVSCIPCNQHKADRTPEQAGMRLQTRPVRPRSLPNVNTFAMSYKPGMPESWKELLRNVVYWDGEIQED